MKRAFVLSFLFTLLIFSLAFAGSRYDYQGSRKIIKRHCKIEYPDDYDMRVYCINEQKKAFRSLRNKKYFKNIPTGVCRTIRKKCEYEWGDDYAMQLYCEKNQVKAWYKLQRE